MTAFTAQCDDYLNQRTGCYEYRSIRYNAAAVALNDLGLGNAHTLLDVGAGWTEFDYHIRVAFDWKGRYIPVDGGIDNTDLNVWNPPRRYDFVVALEILEHMYDPGRLVRRLQANTDRGIAVSVPNPRTVDVIGIDPTHVTVVTRAMLEDWGFEVEEAMFYGGVFSDGEPDSLFGTWRTKLGFPTWA